MRLFPRISIVLVLIASLTACKGSHELKGKVLHIPLKDNVRTADPAQIDDIIGQEVIAQVYETLYQYNYFASTAEVVPMLAARMPTVSKDGLTYTFALRKDVRFQDDPCFKETQGKGRPLVAEDVIYGWRRLANIKNEPQGTWVFDGKVAGFSELQKNFDERPIEGMRALDDHTIQLKLTKPYPQLLYVLTMGYTAPVAKEAVAMYGKDFVTHPVGTGPFRVQSYNPTSRITLVKNENYHEEFFPAADRLRGRFKALAAYSGKRLPLADALDFEVVKEEQPRWLGFVSGKFDQIQIPKDNFNSAIRNKTEVTPELAKKGISVSIEPSLGYWYVSMNVKDKLLGSNKHLRQAIASAVDAEQWLQIFKNGRGTTQTEISPLAIQDRCGHAYRWPFNLERAKQLLAKAGYPEGRGLPTIRYDTRNADLSERQLAEFLAKNLSKIGVKLDITVNTFPAYLDKAHKANLQLSKGGWIMDYPDAENNYQLLYGPNKAPGPNEASFDHPEFNKLYEKIAVMRSGAQRRALICEMEDLLQEEVPWAYGIFEDEYRLAQKWIKNFHTAELVYTKWKYVDIDDREKETLARR